MTAFDSFYFKCPLCDWRTYDFDSSYWSKRYQLDHIRNYERHYRDEHHPIPLPEYIQNSI